MQRTRKAGGGIRSSPPIKNPLQPSHQIESRRWDPLQPSPRTEDSGGIRFEPARLRRAHLLRKTDSANEICLSPSTPGVKAANGFIIESCSQKTSSSTPL